jgi:hypothetical protein
MLRNRSFLSVRHTHKHSYIPHSINRTKYSVAILLVRFMNIKMAVFWDGALSSAVEVY